MANTTKDVSQDEVEAKRLIALIKNGDEAAFGDLVSRYKSQVAALAYRMVNDYDEAADIAQSVFVKMVKNVHKYDPKKKFYTWLYRITVNAAIDHMRKHRRHRHEPLEDYHDSIENYEANPELTFRREQLRNYIRQAAETLNEKQKSAFILRDVEGCKVDDVADIMDMPEATVRWYLHRARLKIRRELYRRCPHLLVALGIK